MRARVEKRSVLGWNKSSAEWLVCGWLFWTPGWICQGLFAPLVKGFSRPWLNMSVGTSLFVFPFPQYLSGLDLLWIIMHSMNFGIFYGTFYVEVGNFSSPKLEGKNTTAWYFRWRNEEKILFGKWVYFDARILVSKYTQKSTWLISPFYLRRTMIPFAKKTRGWYHLFIFDAPWLNFRKRQYESQHDSFDT